jgi:tRNA threonylcarbamoyladenosine modification (KEOPS) complex  Pcc1 subunit
LPSASLMIKLDRPAKDYIKIVGKGEDYKRGSVSFKAHGKELEIEVSAKDAVAMLSSLSSALKRLKVVSSVDSLLSRKTA